MAAHGIVGLSIDDDDDNYNISIFILLLSLLLFIFIFPTSDHFQLYSDSNHAYSLHAYSIVSGFLGHL